MLQSPRTRHGRRRAWLTRGLVLSATIAMSTACNMLGVLIDLEPDGSGEATFWIGFPTGECEASLEVVQDVIDTEVMPKLTTARTATRSVDGLTGPEFIVPFDDVDDVTATIKTIAGSISNGVDDGIDMDFEFDPATSTWTLEMTLDPEELLPGPLSSENPEDPDCVVDEFPLTVRMPAGILAFEPIDGTQSGVNTVRWVVANDHGGDHYTVSAGTPADDPADPEDPAEEVDPDEADDPDEAVVDSSDESVDSQEEASGADDESEGPVIPFVEIGVVAAVISAIVAVIGLSRR